MENRTSNTSIRMPNCQTYYSKETPDPLVLLNPTTNPEEQLEGQHEKTITFDDQSDKALSRGDERMQEKATGVSHEVSSVTHIDLRTPGAELVYGDQPGGCEL